MEIGVKGVVYVVQSVGAISGSLRVSTKSYPFTDPHCASTSVCNDIVILLCLLST